MYLLYKYRRRYKKKQSLYFSNLNVIIYLETYSDHHLNLESKKDHLTSKSLIFRQFIFLLNCFINKLT